MTASPKPDARAPDAPLPSHHQAVDIISAAAILLTLVMLVGRIAGGHEMTPELAAITAITLWALSTPAALQRFGLSPARAATLFVGMGMVVAAATAWTQGGLMAVGAAWISTGPLALSLFGTARQVMAVWGLGAVGLLVLYAAQLLGLTPEPVEVLPAMHLTNQLGVISLIGVISVLAVRVRQRWVAAEREGREALEALADGAGAALLVVQDGEVRFSNPAGRRMGMEPGAAVHGTALGPLIAAADGDEHEITYVCPVDGPKWWSARATPVAFLGGPAVLITAWDTSERRRTEAERVRSEARLAEARRLETMGILAGGVAHDFNNLLVAILANTSMLKEQLPDGDAREMVDDIDLAGTQAAELVRQLLAYAGRGSAARAPVDLRRLVEEGARVQRGAARGDGVELEVELHGTPAGAEVLTDRSQLSQVVANLVRNAVQASAPGQTVRLRVGPPPAAEARPPAVGAPVRGPALCVEVIDAGRGIPEGLLGSIFDPFFTTRTGGRGLGLAAVAGILQRLGASLHVDSAPGAGSTVRVTLPVHTQLGDAEPPAPPAPDPGRAPPGWILVLDDEPLVRAQVLRTLQRAGLDARPAASVAEALERVRGDPPGLALVDYLMPDMNGDEAVLRLRQIDPELPALLLSGFGAPAPERHGELYQARIAKPYAPAELVAEVQRWARPAGAPAPAPAAAR